MILHDTCTCTKYTSTCTSVHIHVQCMFYICFTCTCCILFVLFLRPSDFGILLLNPVHRHELHKCIVHNVMKESVVLKMSKKTEEAWLVLYSIRKHYTYSIFTHTLHVLIHVLSCTCMCTCTCICICIRDGRL